MLRLRCHECYCWEKGVNAVLRVDARAVINGFCDCGEGRFCCYDQGCMIRMLRLKMGERRAVM